MYTTKKVKEGMNKPESERAEEKEPSPKMMQIEVTTLRNGYALMYEGSKRPEGYMYFSPQELVKGIMCHIGLNMNNELDMSKADTFIEAAMKWGDTKKSMKEIERLRSKLTNVTGNRNSIARKIIIERNQMMLMVDRILKLKERYKKAKMQHKDMSEVLKDIDSLIDKRSKHLRAFTPENLGIKDDIYAAADINDDEEDEA
jgi:fructose-specific phosphotransferase system component IIB